MKKNAKDTKIYLYIALHNNEHLRNITWLYRENMHIKYTLKFPFFMMRSKKYVGKCTVCKPNADGSKLKVLQWRRLNNISAIEW